MARSDPDDPLVALTSAERQRLLKRAARLRDEARRQATPARGGERKGSGRNLGELPAWARRFRDATIEDWARRLLAEDQAAAPGGEVADDAPFTGVVVWTGRRICRVVSEGEERAVHVTGDVAAEQRTELAVGDEVRFSVHGDAAVLGRVCPRRTALSRLDPHDSRLERVIVANVDVVLVVLTLRDPPLRLGLLDRALVAVERGGAAPLLCVNKVDLLDAGEDEATLEAALAPYRALGIGAVRVSAVTGQGLDGLRAAIAGRTVALLGGSGVGKSSLLNALAPDVAARTGAVSGHHGKGRHTTTGSTLYELGSGTRIIDTPGLRAFSLGRMEMAELRWGFPDLGALASGCRYDDCAHLTEPECAVQRAVDEGTLPARRLQSYRRIAASLVGGEG